MKRAGMFIAIGLGSLVLAGGALSVWNKSDFCGGWARHHADRAAQFRADASNPALARDEARELLVSAEVHEIIAAKYARVAHQPWRRYPGYPLATPEDLRVAASRH